MRRPLFLLLLAAGIAITGAAQARKEPPPYRPATPTIFALPEALMIAGFDRDGDTRVSRAEYDAGIVREWTRADANGDGIVGAIEHGTWAALVLGSPGALPNLLDLDKDGDDRISRAEFIGYFAARFAALDKDGDGSIARSELITLRVPPAGPEGRTPGAPSAPKGSGGEGAPGGGRKPAD